MRIKPKKQKKIALCMGINDYFEHGIARGIVRYSKQQEEWKLSGYGWMFGGIDDLTAWDGDGIITRAESPEDADKLSSLGIPVVDVAGAYTDAGFHMVLNDDFQTGKKAGLYLKSCGFINLAYCGVEKVSWSQKRVEGFLSGCLNTGYDNRSLPPDASAEGKKKVPEQNLPIFERSLSWWENLETSGALNQWLSDLPKPVGIFACNDTAGVKIAGICRNLNIAVPEEVAVLGVDNEDILCELSNPSLSSIQLDCEEIGFRAAELLDTLLLREEPGRKWISEVQIPPGELIERDTTRTFVCPDPVVREAVNYIRRNFQSNLQVIHVADHVNSSRRGLEVKFRKSLDRTINTLIMEARMNHIKKQLVSTEKTMETLAEESGYGSIQRFHSGFKKETGITPGQYRNRNRRG
ncbi:MAG: DNA-binding transcriptional regulator [Spirochaetales bacterium]|nr:DNA-binding transcriptional regulator [Spirochaetales bacterium]